MILDKLKPVIGEIEVKLASTVTALNQMDTHLIAVEKKWQALMIQYLES